MHFIHETGGMPRQRTLCVVSEKGDIHQSPCFAHLLRCNRVRLSSICCEFPLFFSLDDLHEHSIRSAKARHLKSNTILACEFINEDCINRLNACAATVRVQFGSNDVQDAVYVSESEENSAQDSEFFFGAAGAAFAPTARLQSSTCVVIKPHVLAAGTSYVRAYTTPLVLQISAWRFVVCCSDILCLQRVCQDKQCRIL
jgi:hypothetical protein